MSTEPDNNTLNIQPRSYTNSAGRNVLEYVTPDTIILDLHFIMTNSRRLTKSMPYMKLEQKVVGNDIKAVRLLDFYDTVEIMLSSHPDY